MPVDFWASEGFYRQLKAATGLAREEFLDLHDVDFRYIDGPRYVGPPLNAAGSDEVDIWGVPRRSVTVKTAYGEEVYKEVARHPLGAAHSVEEVADYAHWPSPDWFDYAPIRSQCEAVRRKGRVVVFMGDRLNRVAQLKPAMYLRGVERIFLDLAERPEIAEAIFSRLRAFYCEYLARVLDAADGLIDIVCTGDDFGSQNGLLLSPAMWRSFSATDSARTCRLSATTARARCTTPAAWSRPWCRTWWLPDYKFFNRYSRRRWPATSPR